MSIWCNPRRVPQPGQWNPVRARNGQGGNRPGSAGLKTNKVARQGIAAKATAAILNRESNGSRKVAAMTVSLIILRLCCRQRDEYPYEDGKNC